MSQVPHGWAEVLSALRTAVIARDQQRQPGLPYDRMLAARTAEGAAADRIVAALDRLSQQGVLGKITEFLAKGGK